MHYSTPHSLLTIILSPHVESVYIGSDGILNVLKSQKKAALLIDASTIDPAVARKVGELAAAAGSRFLDAPVSGGVGGAQAGTLTFMVGAQKEHFDEANAILKSMGKNIVHCGAVGTGQVAKICNNMMLGISMIGVSETMNLGVKLASFAFDWFHSSRPGLALTPNCWQASSTPAPAAAGRAIPTTPARASWRVSAVLSLCPVLMP